MAITRINDFPDGTTTDGPDVEEDLDNIINNGLKPDNIDDASDNVAAMKVTEDPYPADTESLATDLSGELKRLRFLVKQITGESEWYIDPDTDLASIIGGQMTLTTKTATYVVTADDGIILVSGTSTITLPSGATTGKAYAIKNIGTGVITIQTAGSELIDGFAVRYLEKANDYLFVYFDSANYQILGQSRAKNVLLHKGLVVKTKTSDRDNDIDIDANVLDVEDANGNIHRLTSVNVTNQIDGAPGINAIDTGAVAINTTYAVWVVYNPTTNTIGSLTSLSFTLGGLNLPTDYTQGRLVDFVRRNGSNVNINFTSVNGTHLWDSPADDTQALTAGSATSFADVDITSWAGDASLVKTAIIGWMLEQLTEVASITSAYLRPNGTAGTNGKLLGKATRNDSNTKQSIYASGEIMIHLDANLKIEYKVSVATADLDLYVNGVVLNI